MSIVEEINLAHAEYIERTGKNPNVAYVKVRWKSDNEESDNIEAIAIDGVDAIHDEDILFYCNSLQGLIGLTTEGPGEDFIVTTFI
ncbi:MAG: hypothetical protein KBT34_12040 [Prevotella sp.]|nr:hypothetical protein [Candidatus Prevotella equi]